MHIATTFVGDSVGGRYRFYLLTEEYLEANKTIRSALEPLLTEFARDLGSQGGVVRPFPGYEDETRASVTTKDWTPRELARIRQTPGMLGLEVKFDEFDPRRDEWLHISLRDLMDQYGHVEVHAAKELFDDVAEAAKSEAGLFGHFRGLIHPGTPGEIAELFELRPGIFGLSFDVKGLAGLVRRRVRG